jgi:hypothetical protein
LCLIVDILNYKLNIVLYITDYTIHYIIL